MNTLLNPLREDLSSTIIPVDRFDKMTKAEFFNVTSAQNSEVEMIPDWNHHRWEQQNMEALDSLSGKFSHYHAFLGIGTGSRKACADSGLSGKEKRDCAKKLRQGGWKKGQPIPAGMAGITPAEAAAPEAIPASADVATVDKSAGGAKPSGMSTGMMIGIALGSVTLLAGLFFLATKKSAPQVIMQPVPVVG